MVRVIRKRLILYLLLLVVATALCAVEGYFIVMGHSAPWSPLFWGSLLVMVMDIVKVVKCYTVHLQKIKLLFEAVENNDFTFRFSDHKGHKDEQMTNTTLNRVKELLAQAKLDASLQEQYFELIMNKSATGIVVCDERGHVMQSNETARLFLAQPHLTHLSQLDNGQVTLSDRQAKAVSAEMMDCTPQHTLQLVVVSEQGTVTLSVSSSCFTKNESSLRIFTFNDISSVLDKKELESWIRLTRVLTHEIMNSIAPIRSLSEMLIGTNQSLNPELTRGLELIHSTSGNLITFVSRYRQFATIPPPVKEEVEVVELLTQCRRLLLPDLSAKIKIYIDTTQEENTPPLKADRGQLVQVMVNLIRNAAEAMEAQQAGKITLSAQCPAQQHWVIDVANNGTPIPQELVEQLFVPFFTTKEGGSGIGLSLSKQILNNHGGSLQLLHSTAEGTLFRVTLPIYP